jgi:hypothetical protein
MMNRRKTSQCGQVAIVFILSMSVSQACDSELPHCESIHTKVVATADRDVGPKVVYRVDDFTIQVDAEYLLTALGRSGVSPSGSRVVARLREETSVATITDASYVLALTYDILKAEHESSNVNNGELGLALKTAEQDLLIGLSQAIEFERAVVTHAPSSTELGKLRLTMYRCECGSGKVFTTMAGDVVLKVVEPSK